MNVLKLFNSYKKAPTKDFTTQDLPENRYRLLIDILKNNFWKLASINGLYIIFLIPAFFITIIFFSIAVGLLNNGALTPRFLPYIADPSVIFPTGKSFFDMGISVFDVLLAYLSLLIIALAIAGPAKAGLYYVMRNISWGEYSFSYSDFWKSFKANWKQGVFFNLLTGVIYLCTYYGLFFYDTRYNTTNNVIYLYAFWIVIFILVFYTIMKMFFFPQLVTYKLTIMQIIKNSFIFTMIQLFKALPLALVPIAMAIIGLPFNVYLVGVFIYLLIGYAFVALINMNFSNYIFDKYLNDLIPEATKRKGMRPIEVKSDSDE